MDESSTSTAGTEYRAEPRRSVGRGIACDGPYQVLNSDGEQQDGSCHPCGGYDGAPLSAAVARAPLGRPSHRLAAAGEQNRPSYRDSRRRDDDHGYLLGCTPTLPPGLARDGSRGLGEAEVRSLPRSCEHRQVPGEIVDGERYETRSEREERDPGFVGVLLVGRCVAIQAENSTAGTLNDAPRRR